MGCCVNSSINDKSIILETENNKRYNRQPSKANCKINLGFVMNINMINNTNNTHNSYCNTNNEDPQMIPVVEKNDYSREFTFKKHIKTKSYDNTLENRGDLANKISMLLSSSNQNSFVEKPRRNYLRNKVLNSSKSYMKEQTEDEIKTEDSLLVNQPISDLQYRVENRHKYSNNSLIFKDNTVTPSFNKGIFFAFSKNDNNEPQLSRREKNKSANYISENCNNRKDETNRIIKSFNYLFKDVTTNTSSHSDNNLSNFIITNSYTNVNLMKKYDTIQEQSDNYNTLNK